MRGHSYLAMIVLTVLLIAAMVALAVLYPRATRTLVQPHQQPLVERAERRAAAFFHHSVADRRRITFPVVMELGDRTCVELKSTEADGAGGYLACFTKGGRLIEEQASVGF